MGSNSSGISVPLHGLFSEDFEDRKMAGRALVVASHKSQEIAERLFDLLRTPIDAEITVSALSTLFFGGPTYPGSSDVISQAKKSTVPTLQVAALGRYYHSLLATLIPGRGAPHAGANRATRVRTRLELSPL